MELDPALFVRAPYSLCPSCTATDGLGVLSISGQSCIKRCRRCGFRTTLVLPPTPRRRVVYLDQFVVSNVAKSRAPGEARGEHDPFWGEVDHLLVRLALKQLAAFPTSSFLDDETTVANERDAIQAVYTTLAGDFSFSHQISIEHEQLFVAAKAWAEGEPLTAGPLDPSDRNALRGDLDAWQDTMSIMVPLTDLFTSELRQRRQAAIDTIVPSIFECAEARLTFEEHYKQEVESNGAETVKQISSELLRYSVQGQSSLKLPSTSWLRFMYLRRGFESAGMDEEDAACASLRFLQDFDALQTVPFIRIQGLLWAALALRVQHGMTQIQPSIVNDVLMIGTLLPYCDAMFVDNQCRSLVIDEPVASRLLPYSTSVFSMSNKADFRDFLLEIESTAPRDHLELVRQVIADDI